MVEKADYNFKVVTVGDGACGKTSMLMTYVKGIFPTEYVPTIFENHTKRVQLVNGKTVEFLLVDTAGQEDYARLRPLSYANVDMIIIAYSIDSFTSLENVIEKWWPEVKHHCAKGTPMMLVGMKEDVRNDPQVIDIMKQQGYMGPVPYDKGVQVSQQIGRVPFLECSAKEGTGLYEIFDRIVNILVPPERETSGGCSCAIM
ncbi:P-loop containing nucleoside triphosphate hydrolase protein [Kockiozyma suomiensis]|uniref:P-loop containing nucleoside triphosphate hydrolase protein n=1 Tax=Kockiozyma suomiensis TaxID=1337062 RepID=UPI0033431436